MSEKKPPVPRLIHQQIAGLLGREPRGLRAVAVSDPEGGPQVIQVASLVNDKPFPTLFWLVDRDLNYALDRLEADGLIAALQNSIDENPTLQQSMIEDHRRHIALRNSLMTQEETSALKALGFYPALQKRGIGGIEKPTRIRCLHTWYAAHLVEPNTVGRLVDQHWDQSG